MVQLETERLILRNFVQDDFSDLLEYLSDPLVVKFEPYKVMSEKEVRDNLNWRCSTDEMIAVVLKESGKLIGNVYIGNRDFESREIGYVFNQKFWGKGYAKEACSAVMAQAFENGVHRIFAECDPQNPNSWKLLEVLGFKREAHFVQNVYFWKDEEGNPIWKDTYVYGKLAGTEEVCEPKVLLENLEKIHTTQLGVERIKKNLSISASSEKEVADFCKKLVSAADCKITKNGKNWYCRKEGMELTINGFNYCVITAKKIKY